MATLVAKDASPAVVLNAVADEFGRLVGTEASYMARVELSTGHRPGHAAEHEEPEGACIAVGSYGSACATVPAGYRFPPAPGTVTATALKTGGPAPKPRTDRVRPR